MKLKTCLTMLAGGATTLAAVADNSFRVTPYVQHPAKDAISLLWLAQTNGNASVSWWVQGGAVTNTIASATEIQPTDRVADSRFTANDVLQYCRAPEFDYNLSPESGDNYPTYKRETVGKSQEGAGWSMPYTVPYQYRVRLTGLQADTTYGYRVTLADGQAYEKVFRTAPANWKKMRFVYYSDSETEPADNPLSTGRTTDWTDPNDATKTRTYYATQTEAYATNVARVVEFAPDLIVMAGDLAQKGSRQCDWDEFWRHNAGPLNDPAGSIPIVASPGNHDYWSYNDGGEVGMKKYTSYFEFEPNGTEVEGNLQERFHRVDYGPATFLFMDANNGDDSDETKDTNRYMSRTTDYPGSSSSTCRAPDFNPGSAQYSWLETQLQDAQQKSAFIFVVSHQCPFSVGDHGQPNGTNGEKLSGRPLRVLLDLFHRYGVTAWLAGHDEMMERSTDTGTETLPDSSTRSHTMHIWDMGIAGDGLRGGMKIENTQQAFRAAVDSTEVYDANGIQTDGGVHYGHLEVSIDQRADGAWVATFDPVYEFFTTNAQGQAVFGGTRRYVDTVTVVNESTIQPAVHHTAKATGPGGLLRFNDGTAAAEVSCDAAIPVTLTAVPQAGYEFYRWIGDTDGMDEATVTGATLTVTPDRAKSYRAVFLRKTGTGTASFIDEPASGASWFDASNWVGGELPVAGDVVTVTPNDSSKNKYSLILEAPTPRYASVLINHGSSGGCVLTMTNWTTRLEADTITLGGYASITCAGPFGANEMSNRIWLVCNDFTMKKGQRINLPVGGWTSFGYLDANNKGYKVANGPGTCDGGASHGGTGATQSNSKLLKLPVLPYDDAASPQMPGSGGGKSSKASGTAGGGAIRIDATGTVTIENNKSSDYPNAIMASVTESNTAYGLGSGSGGSICITCRRFVCGRAKILANGGDGRTNWDTLEHSFNLSLPGGGGRIAIRYDSAYQQTGDVANTTLSAEGGQVNSQQHGDSRSLELSNRRSPTIADRYFQDADLGSVWFTDDKLLKDLLGKGLSGSVVNPVAPTLGSLVFNKGFVRFPLDGETMTIAGDLAISGACTRLEFGGTTPTNWLVVGTHLRTKEPWTLNIGGDVTLGNGARLDVRPAMTNGTLGVGALVSVDGTLALGGYTNEYATIGGDRYRVTNTSVVVWNDGYTGVAPRFEVGSLTVASNSFITAYRRGYLGGGSLSDAGVTNFPCYGFGPVVSNAVIKSKTYTWYGGGDSSNSGNEYGGGGHGGRGGYSENSAKSAYRGQTYDDPLRPVMAGSGGGGRYIGNSTMPGGGAIRVVAKDAISVDGIICADGTSKVAARSSQAQDYGNGGAGAGGSILLECQQFSGSGVLTACGGVTTSGDTGKRYSCGGGGRIAVWTGVPYEPGQRKSRCTVSETPAALRDKGILFTGTASAVGGLSNLHDTYPSMSGDDGTVRFVYNREKQGVVLIVR